MRGRDIISEIPNSTNEHIRRNEFRNALFIVRVPKNISELSLFFISEVVEERIPRGRRKVFCKWTRVICIVHYNSYGHIVLIEEFLHFFDHFDSCISKMNVLSRPEETLLSGDKYRDAPLCS